MYDYKAKKKAKLAKLEKAGDEYILTIVRFDQDTGKKKEPVKLRLNKESLEKRKVGHKEEIADIDAILAEMKLLS